MDINFYIKISPQFANDMSGKESEINPCSFFGSTITLSGQNVCSINSANDFPDQFATLGPLTVVTLSASDFPVTPPIQ